MYWRCRGERRRLGDRFAHRQGGCRVDRGELEIVGEWLRPRRDHKTAISARGRAKVVSANPLRVACIGIGWWSDVLADAIQRSGKLAILSCYTRSEEKRNKFAAKYRCRPAASYEAMLADGEIEAIINTTPNDVHLATSGHRRFLPSTEIDGNAQTLFVRRSRHGRLDTSQSRLQRCFLGVIKRSLQHCTAFALETLKHLIRSDLPYQDEERRCPGLDGGRRVLDEFVVDANIGQSAADCAGGSAQRGTGERHQKDEANQRSPKSTTDSSCGGGVDHLV